MGLPNPTFIGQQIEVNGKTYQAASVNPPVWRGVTTGTHGRRLEELETSVAKASREVDTIYVNSTAGSDISGDGSNQAPYQTLQKAWDSLPDVIYKQQNIILAPGIYDDVDTTQARPAVLNAYGKSTSLRTALVNDNLIGAVIIKSSTGVRGDVTISCGAGQYSIYAQKGNIGIQDVTLTGDAAAGLLVAHRTDTYVQCYNVLFNGGSQATNERGVYTESGGQIELSDKCLITNCGIGASTITDGDNITISGSSKITFCNTGAFAKSGSIYFNMSDTSLSSNNMVELCDIGIDGIDGQVEVRGADSSSLARIADPVNGKHMFVEFVYAEINDVVNLESDSTLRLNNVGYNNPITLVGGTLHHIDSNSYISGQFSNVGDIPIVLRNGANYIPEGTNNLVGSAGTFTPYARTYAGSADGATIPVTDDVKVIYLNGNGAARTGCQLDAGNVPDGYTVYVEGSTWSIELVNGANMYLSSPITIGNSTGMYEGATFTKSRGLWRCTGLGQQN